MEGWTGSNEYNTKMFGLVGGGWRIQQLQTLKCVLCNTNEAALTSEQTLRAKTHSGISGGRTPGVYVGAEHEGGGLCREGNRNSRTHTGSQIKAPLWQIFQSVTFYQRTHRI